MTQLFFYLLLGGTGLIFGSFAGATVWRLRARQLVEDRAAGEEYDKLEYKQLLPLTKQRGSQDRSRCLSCSHQLAWYDLLPLVSWLSTGGRCRYCSKNIGWFEPLIELGMAGLFVISFLLWPQPLIGADVLELAAFGLWLLAIVMLVILFAYDLKWFLLPNVIMFPLMVVAALIAQIHVVQAPDVTAAILSLDGAVLILSGLYLTLFVAGGFLGRSWIGFGDIKLGLVLGLLLGDWQLAFLTLFLANLVGVLIVIPGLITKKLSRTTQVPFGPMFITGFFIAALVGHQLIEWYLVTTTTLFI